MPRVKEELTEEQLLEKYRNNLVTAGIGNRFTILEVTKATKPYKFLFRDKLHNIEFVYNYDVLKTRLKKNPDRKFRANTASLKGLAKWKHVLKDYGHLLPKKIDKEGFCIITDTRVNCDFKYQSPHQVVSELEVNPEKSFRYLETPEENMIRKLNDLAPGRFSEITVTERTASNRPVVSCYDSLYQEKVHAGWTHMCGYLGKDPKHRFEKSKRISPEEKWQNKLNKLGAPHLKILKLEGFTSDAKSYIFRFLDTRKNYEFSYSASNAYVQLVKNSQYEFKLDIPIDEYYQQKLDDIIPGRFEVVAHLDTRFRKKENGAISSVSHQLQIKDIIHDQEFVHEASTLVSKIKDKPSLVISSNIERYVDGKMVKHRTGIEATVESWLKEFGVAYEFNPYMGGVRPDFFIPAADVAIECDGLYWHSELKRDKQYHINKRDVLENQGLVHLAFREPEILEKPQVCRSIIMNALGMSTRVFARKCSFSTTTSQFFEENHLMGKGSGRIYSLEYEGDTVAAVQVKWVASTNKEVLDISRFSTKTGISVVGGFSRLIKKAIKEESPKTVRTFIDRRYGRGFHLEKRGWRFVREGVSFVWTDFHDTYHRMRYPSKTGYDHGLVKIWDCGQAKWELTV